jgi:hypothetical protein
MDRRRWLWIGLTAIAAAFELVMWDRWRAPEPPPIATALDDVCARLVASARAKGLAGSAREIERVTGPDKDVFFDALAPELNGRLVSGFDTFLPKDDVRREVTVELARLLKDRAWVSGQPDFTRRPPTTLLFAAWEWAPRPQIRLTLRAVRLAAAADGAQATVTFVHPDVAEEQRRRRARDRRAALAVAPVLGALALASTFTLFSTGHRGRLP